MVFKREYPVAEFNGGRAKGIPLRGIFIEVGGAGVLVFIGLKVAMQEFCRGLLPMAPLK